MAFIEILYIDQYLAVINKPAGLLSVPFPGFKGKTAQSVLEDILRKQGKANAHHRPFAVHRLDRDTSGVMMFALSQAAQKKIMDDWHKIVTERLYHALAEVPRANSKFPPLPEPNEGWIKDELSFNKHHVGYVKRDGEGGPSRASGTTNRQNSGTTVARTHYKIIKQGSRYALFELSLDTGKKNQIRAHLAAYGYPLAGDKEHRALTDPFNRLCLHACSLEFTHPFTHETMKFEVPEPKEWELRV
ncbi:MAG: RluA family pseudouridine synthase [Treponema sp.]|nr:RluA family pseudouridine synthase [Treponema sp.]